MNNNLRDDVQTEVNVEKLEKGGSYVIDKFAPESFFKIKIKYRIVFT